MARSIEVDYYQIEELLSEEERVVRDVARRFVEEEFMPQVQRCFREGSFPMDLIPRLGQLGFLGMTLPPQYGCAGLNNIAYGLVSQELERGDSGLRSFASVQSALVMYPIHAFGSAEQKDRFLPRLQKAELIGCFGLTEPDFGSNPGGMKTRAVKKGDRWILNGNKMWITNSPFAHVAVVWAKVDDEVHGFIVERGMKGYETPEIKGK